MDLRNRYEARGTRFEAKDKRRKKTSMRRRYGSGMAFLKDE